MRKPKGRGAHYEDAGLTEDDDFGADVSFREDESTGRPKPRNANHTRQQLEIRDEEQWLRKQLSDWDDDFDF